jgi:hypothetical protein
MLHISGDDQRGGAFGSEQVYQANGETFRGTLGRAAGPVDAASEAEMQVGDENRTKVARARSSEHERRLVGNRAKRGFHARPRG